MFIYFGRRYISAATGSQVREVRCEKCGAAYYYEMIRVGSGQASSAYMLNNAGAAARARGGAQASAADALDRGSDPVPCPDCGWFQTHMVRDARRERHAWLRLVGYVVPGIVALVCGILYINFLTSHGRRNEDAPMTLLLVAVTAVASGAAMLYTRNLLARRFDPNAGYPKPPEPIPGMPPALKPLPSAPVGRPVLIFADRRSPAVVNGWITVQLPRVVWPSHCCGCMGVAETNFRPSFRISQADDRLPLWLCHACARTFKRRTYLWALLAWPITIGVVAGALTAMPFGDVWGRLAIGFVVGAILSVLMMFVLPTLAVRLSRLKVMDAKRAIYRLKFANPSYVEALAQLYGSTSAEPPITQPATRGFPVLPVLPVLPALPLEP